LSGVRRTKVDVARKDEKRKRANSLCPLFGEGKKKRKEVEIKAIVSFIFYHKIREDKNQSKDTTGIQPYYSKDTYKINTLKKSIMAKKSMIQRELKRQGLVMKYAKKRDLLKQQITASESLKDKLMFHRKLQELPKNSSSVRLHNRCMITGRPKGYYRDFGLSRHLLREMAHQGLLPGVQKSSW
jgi:small subunit ribosomal protein S14